MTAFQLLTYITLALLLQVLAGVAWAMWQRSANAGGALPAMAPEAAPSPTGAWSGWRDFRVVRRVFEDAAQTQCSFYLQPLDGATLPPFQPGQYLTFALKVPHDKAGGERTITRCYSLSDRPDPTGYRITIKRMPPPAARPELPPGASSGHFHDRVHEGDVLQGEGAIGPLLHRP